MNAHDLITRHIEQVRTVAAAGITPSQEWETLAARWDTITAERDDIATYAAAAAQGTATDTQYALAIAAAMSNPIARATVTQAAAQHIAQALALAWRNQAAAAYETLRRKYNQLGETFAKHAAVTNPEGQPIDMVGASPAAQKSYLAAAVTAEEIAAATPPLLAAAALAGKPLTTNETIAGATIQRNGTRKRVVWEILDGEPGRCRHYGLLVNAGCTIAAPELDDLGVTGGLERPGPLETRYVRDGIGWRPEVHDPELEHSK